MDTQKIDARLKELEEELLLLSGHIGASVADNLKDTLKKLDQELASIAKQVAGGAGKSDGDQKALAKELTAAAVKLGTISKTLDSIGTSLGMQDGKPPKTAIPDQVSKTVADAATAMKKDLDGAAGTLDKRIGEVAGTVTDAVSKQADEAKKRHVELAALLTDVKERSGSIAKLLEAGDLSGIGARFDGMEKSVTEAAASLAGLPKQLEKQTTVLSKDVTGAIGKAAADREEIKNTLMRDHDELHRSLEIIRRMCTTDEEKFLGSVVSMLHERLSSLPDAIEGLSKKQGTLDKNIQVASQNNMTKQDEIKKVLLYDIGAIAETIGVLRELCDTGEDAPLGSQVTEISERSADIPAILEHVSDISSRMDGLVAQVRLMRWFVLGAVGISLTVLILSFVLFR